MAADDFPLDQDNYIGGSLSTTSPSGQTTSKGVNIVVYVKRKQSEVKTNVVKNVVKAVNPTLNE